MNERTPQQRNALVGVLGGFAVNFENLDDAAEVLADAIMASPSTESTRSSIQTVTDAVSIRGMDQAIVVVTAFALIAKGQAGEAHDHR